MIKIRIVKYVRVRNHIVLRNIVFVLLMGDNVPMSVSVKIARICIKKIRILKKKILKDKDTVEWILKTRTWTSTNILRIKTTRIK